MTAPSIDQAPPGYYMLFLVDNQGVPSVAPIMRFDKTAGQPASPRVTQSSQNGFSSRALTPSTATTRQGRAGYAQTSTESQPWWKVDLGASSKDIATWPDHLGPDSGNTGRDVWVFASKTPFNSTSVAATQAQPGVTALRLRRPRPTPAPPRSTRPPATSASRLPARALRSASPRSSSTTTRIPRHRSPPRQRRRDLHGSRALTIRGQRLRPRRHDLQGRVLPRLDPRRDGHELALLGQRLGRRRGHPFADRQGLRQQQRHDHQQPSRDHSPTAESAATGRSRPLAGARPSRLPRATRSRPMPPTRRPVAKVEFFRGATSVGTTRHRSLHGLRVRSRRGRHTRSRRGRPTTAARSWTARPAQSPSQTPAAGVPRCP